MGGCDGRAVPATGSAPDAETAADAGSETDAGASTDAGPGTDAAPDPDAGVAAVGYAELFASVLYPRCSGCHDGTPRGQSPAVGSYDALVTAVSSQVPGMPLVAPGDADASYLFRKVAGTHTDVCRSMGVAVIECGSQMPRGIGAVPLDDGEIATVRAWIESGALP